MRPRELFGPRLDADLLVQLARRRLLQSLAVLPGPADREPEPPLRLSRIETVQQENAVMLIDGQHARRESTQGDFRHV
ncbi:hypothetical protein GCM10020001_052450 [Nonomuraea salmonea]